MENGIKLYGDNIQNLPIQKINNGNIETISGLQKEDMKKIATVEMMLITDEIYNSLTKNSKNQVIIESKDWQGKTFSFDVTPGMYVANYGKGELAPIQKADFDKTYERKINQVMGVNQKFVEDLGGVKFDLLELKH